MRGRSSNHKIVTICQMFCFRVSFSLPLPRCILSSLIKASRVHRFSFCNKRFSDIPQVMDLFDRLVKKENQTATIPLVSDIPPYVDNCKVVLCNERGLRHVHHFGNVANKTGEAIRRRASQAVSSFSFQLLHLARESRRKMTARN